MIVKTYSAESATAALKQIRAELGGDAVILKTTKGTSQNGRPAVYVTACAESENESAFPNRLTQSQTLNQPQEAAVFPRRVASKNEIEQPNTRPAVTAPNTSSVATNAPIAAQRGFQLLSQIDQKLDQLLARPVQTSEPTATQTEKNSTVDLDEAPLASRPTTDQTLRSLLQHGYALDVAERLQMKIGDRLISGESISNCEEEILSSQVQDMNFSRGEAVVVIGLPGSGKSSVIATLAQKITFGARLPIRLSSLDATRIAATDELATYAELLGADILTTQQISSYTDGVALIDTPGISGEHSVATIASQLKGIANKKIILAIPSTLSMSALRGIIKKTQPLAPSGIIFTMSDQSSPLPLAVAFSLECELPIYGRIEAGNGASDLHSIFASIQGGGR